VLSKLQNAQETGFINSYHFPELS